MDGLGEVLLEGVVEADGVLYLVCTDDAAGAVGGAGAVGAQQLRAHVGGPAGAVAPLGAEGGVPLQDPGPARRVEVLGPGVRAELREVGGVAPEEGEHGGGGGEGGDAALEGGEGALEVAGGQQAGYGLLHGCVDGLEPTGLPGLRQGLSRPRVGGRSSQASTVHTLQ